MKILHKLTAIARFGMGPRRELDLSASLGEDLGPLADPHRLPQASGPERILAAQRQNRGAIGGLDEPQAAREGRVVAVAQRPRGADPVAVLLEEAEMRRHLALSC